MSCDRAATVLHGYFDSELDALGAAEFERHLEQCSDCINALQGLGLCARP
jgi:anti-sigma factor RsiW